MKRYVMQVRAELLNLSDELKQQSAQQFFKEQIKVYGIKTPVVRAIARKTLKSLAGQDKETIFCLCEDLWQSGYIEESLIACEWAYAQRKNFDAGDIEIFEKWIVTYVNNWASCDTFSNHTVGTLLLQYPQAASRLKKWATHANRWVRRAAAVSLVIPVRQGKFLHEALEIAALQLQDKDDMVQKGYGWMLKVASQPHEKAVFDFVVHHKAVMPRTALRYAIENMPAEMKIMAMAR